MPTLKNAKHELFCQERAKGATQVAAYAAAGYRGNTRTKEACASKIEKRPDVQRRIAELLSEKAKLDAEATVKAAEELKIDKRWIMEKLVDNVHRAMQAEPVYDKQGNPTGEYTYQGNAANRALELLGKQLGMFVDVKKIITTPFDELSFDEAKRLLDGINAALAAPGADAGSAGSSQPSDPARTTH